MNPNAPTLRELFQQATRIKDRAAQSRFLDEACEDEELRLQLDRMLAADSAKVTNPLDRLSNELQLQPPEKADLLSGGDSSAHASPRIFGSIDEKSQIGTRVGPYRLLEKIGEGGMGLVYMAEQRDPVRRTVAVKVIKPGMDSKQVLARFESERQALSMMNHPNIAQVLDAGTTETGLPYFVMALVKGVPINDYCDQQRLDIRERLEVFIQVCRAVQHAHQKGVIHRDLKPSNVLVELHDIHAVPKVIDFGVAKAIDQRLTDRTLHTGLAEMIGTPLYMSPEQAQLSGLDVDTRSDVYSLGVLLYELLSGTTPFDREEVKKMEFDELRRMIREDDPPRPSQAVSTLAQATLSTISERRKISPSKFPDSVRGELDWIVMRALEKDRTRRYESANALANDIQRYLDDEPVEAGPPSLMYKVRKWAKRNRTMVATSSGTLALCALIAGTLLWNERAETLAALKRETEQRKLAELESGRAEENLNLAMKAMDAIYLDAIGTDKLLSEPLASANKNGVTAKKRRSFTEFEQELLHRGLDFYNQFTEQNQASPRATAHTALAYYRVAWLHVAIGNLEVAKDSFQKSIDRLQKLCIEHPDNANYFRPLAKSQAALAKQLPEWSEAKELLKNARQNYARAIELEPENVENYFLRGDVGARLRDPEAAADFEKALELDPNNVRVHLKLSYFYGRTSYDHRDIRKQLEHAERALALEPDNPECHLAIATALKNPDNKGTVVSTGPGQTSTFSMPSEERILKHFDRAIELAPDEPNGYLKRGGFLADIGEHDRALIDLERVLQVEPQNGRARQKRAKVYIGQGLLAKAIADLKLVLEDDPHFTGAYQNLGEAYNATENWSSAVDAFSEFLQREPAAFYVYKRRAFAYIHLKEYDKVLGDLKKSLSIEPRDTSALRWLPAEQVVAAPESFQKGLLELAAEAIKSSPTPTQAIRDRGIVYTQLQEYEHAIDDFRRAILEDPSWEDVWRRWRQACIAKGQIRQELNEFSEQIELDPELGRCLGGLASTWLMLGAYAKAAEGFTQALQLEPKNESLRVQRCAAYALLGDQAKAQKDLSAWREISRQDVRTLYEQALLSLAIGNQAEYRSLCRKVRDANTAPAALISLEFSAWTCILGPDGVDDYLQVLEIIRPGVESDEASMLGRIAYGAALYRAGRIDEAIEHLSATAELTDDPEFIAKSSPAYLWYFLSMAYQAAGEAKEASYWLERANRWASDVSESAKRGEMLLPWNRRVTLRLLREGGERDGNQGAP